MKRLLTITAIVMFVAVAFPAGVQAGGEAIDFGDGKVVFGGTFTLESGETLDGDLAIVGGAVVLMEGSLVDGQVALFGGTLNVNGEIKGDLTVIGGAATLGETAVVGGNLVTFGSVVSRAKGARVEGQDLTGGVLEAPPRLEIPEVVTIVPRPWVWGISPMQGILSGGWFLVRTIVMAALAILVVMFWPDPVARTARAVVRAPLNSGGLGLLTMIAGLIFIILLAITICLIPFSLAGAFLLVAAGVLGWIAIGLELGQRLAVLLKWQTQPALASGLGTLVLSLVVGGIGFMPCVGWVLPMIVMALGLGAVLLTRFGTREYLLAADVSGGAPILTSENLPEKPAGKTRKG